MPSFDRRRAARILADAAMMGDAKAAERWGVTDRSILNWRQRLENDDELAQAFVEELRKAEEDWRSERLKFLRLGLSKLTELVGKADGPHDIRSVAEAVKVVGELQVASDVLNGSPATDQPNTRPPATSGDDGSGEGAEVH
jgi:hypothetical protein